MKTLAFYAVFGVVSGYNHNNNVLKPLQIVSDAWQRAMQIEFNATENLVSAVLHDSNTIYPIGFGCPPGGETTVTVNGHLNPKFIKDKGHAKDINFLVGLCDYREAVIRVCETVKKELKQTTVSIAFYELEDFVYLNSKG